VTKWQVIKAHPAFDEKKIESGVKLMLEGLGLQGEDFNLTPWRVSKALRELCNGLHCDLDIEVYKDGIFEVEHERRMPTTFKNIRARGICPHHLLPVLYKCDVTYSALSKVVGLSRVHRLVQRLAARPVLQEQLAYDIASEMRSRLSCPVTVHLEGLHMCMMARGSKTELDSPVVTDITLE